MLNKISINSYLALPNGTYSQVSNVTENCHEKYKYLKSYLNDSPERLVFKTPYLKDNKHTLIPIIL